MKQKKINRYSVQLYDFFLLIPVKKKNINKMFSKKSTVPSHFKENATYAIVLGFLLSTYVKKLIKIVVHTFLALSLNGIDDIYKMLVNAAYSFRLQA